MRGRLEKRRASRTILSMRRTIRNAVAVIGGRTLLIHKDRELGARRRRLLRQQRCIAVRSECYHVKAVTVSFENAQCTATDGSG